MSILANHLATDRYIQGMEVEAIDAELEYFSMLLAGRVIVIDETYMVIKDTYELQKNSYIVSKNVINGFKGKPVVEHDMDNSYIEIVTPIIDYDSESEDRTTGVILFGYSIENSQLMRNYVIEQSIKFILILFVIIALLACVIGNYIIKPFYRLKKIINSKHDDELIEYDRKNSYEELDEIIGEFNKVIEKQNTLEASRQEFVSNVSHELKTPLTSIKVLAESLTLQDDVPNEIYKEFMEDISTEVERENKIINDLLELVKLDKKEAKLEIQLVDMNNFIEIILKRLKVIADINKVELIFESMREVQVEIDEVKISLAISNLIENAIKYNNEDGEVRVILDADHQYAIIKVADNGIGINEEDISHLFERFFRVDKSHSKDIEGTGLGLSITKNIVVMHRGDIEVESKLDEGTTFTVKLPLKYQVVN